MKKTPLILILALTAIALAPLLWAHGDDAQGERRVHLRLAADGELLDIDDLGDLAVGESRTYYSDDGVPVTITRTENGYEVDKDGEVTTIATPHGVHVLGAAHEGDGQIFIHRQHTEKGEGDDEDTFIMLGGDGELLELGEEHDMAFFSGSGDAPEGHHFVWHGAGAGCEGALERLTASGVLDEVDAETRRKIVDALASEVGHSSMRTIVIKSQHDEDDESEK